MPESALQPEIQRILVHYFDDLKAVMDEEGQGAAFASLLGELDLEAPASSALKEGLVYEDYLAALQRVEEGGRVPALGLRLGSRKRHGFYGLLGLAAQTKGTVGQMNQSAQDGFERCWGRFLRFRTRVQGPWSITRLEAASPALAKRVTLVEQAITTTVRFIADAAAGLDWSVCRATFVFPPPAHAHLYRRFLPFDCRFGQAHNELWTPVAWNRLESSLAEASVHAFCSARLRDLLAPGPEPRGFRDGVGRILRDGFQDPSMDLAAIAERLGTSERSLQAGLAEEGCSFRSIRNQILVERAKVLLADPRRSIKEVAFDLGYAQPPNFTRAFLKLTGETPQRYRSWRPAPVPDPSAKC